VDQVLANTSSDWKLLDCDKDGNPNGTDPNPKVATANDLLTAPFGIPQQSMYCRTMTSAHQLPLVS
jgi:hypothetical protein